MPHTISTLNQLERFERIAEQMNLELSELATWLETLTSALFAPAEPSRLDERETRVLRDMEIIDRKIAQPEHRASLRAAAQYLRLVRSSYSLVEVARKLRTTPEEISDRAKAGALYTIEIDNALLFPDFQFAGGGQVAGLDDVLRRMPDDLDPLEVLGFLNAPAAELEAAGRFRTPLEWLRRGGNPEPVIAMAQDLHLPS